MILRELDHGTKEQLTNFSLEAILELPGEIYFRNFSWHCSLSWNPFSGQVREAFISSRDIQKEVP
jgi:hypothetical protein